MAEPDLSDWLTLVGASQVIGCSTRTVERLGRAKKLEQRLRRQDGTPPVAVYNPDDVHRIASERNPGPSAFVLPAVQAGNGNGRPPASTSPQMQTRLPASIQLHPDDPVRQFFAAALKAILSPPSPPVSEKLAERAAYVDKTEALAIAGVSYGALRAAVQAGEVKQRGRRYRRSDLEGL
jgi:hypothetical protein